METTSGVQLLILEKKKLASLKEVVFEFEEVLLKISFLISVIVHKIILNGI